MKKVYRVFISCGYDGDRFVGITDSLEYAMSEEFFSNFINPNFINPNFRYGLTSEYNKEWWNKCSCSKNVWNYENFDLDYNQVPTIVEETLIEAN